MTTIACITAKDEEETIGDLVCNLEGHGLCVVVVDDGSSDSTGEIVRRVMVRRIGMHLVTHTQSWGIGPSVLHAWSEALRLGADRIVQLDAGGSHYVGDLWRLLSQKADMVIGSRFLPSSRYIGRPWRAALSRLAALACNARTGQRIGDWTSGYRAFTRGAVEQLLLCPCHARMHGCQIEVLGHAIRLGMSIAEVPITYIANRSSFNWRAAREAFGVWSRL